MSNNSALIGRRRERERLQRFLERSEAGFLALYGRRRVGKTFLVRAVLGSASNATFVEATGRKDGSRTTQLQVFAEALARAFPAVSADLRLRDWRQAFEVLTRQLRGLPRGRRCVVFLDELPWLATPRSGLLQELDHCWNTQLGRDSRVRVVACGSAASWMLDKLVHAKGGLHNRLTDRILLEPFNLPEAEAYLAAKGAAWSRELVVQTYMAVGGVPLYLNAFAAAGSPTDAIQETCFRVDGLLYDEFDRLFGSLFRRSERHVRIVRALARRPGGMGRAQLLTATSLKSGDAFNQPVRELEAAGFIQKYVPYGRKVREQWFRLTDEYTLFFLKWIEPVRQRVARLPSRHWLAQRQTPAFRAWAGLAFEGICLKHADALLDALQIGGMAAELSTWRHVPTAGSTDAGAQIDLLVDRADRVISLCEIKYAAEPVTITKAYAAKLRQKMAVFRERTATRKHLQLVLIAPAGVSDNAHARGLGLRQVTLDQLFAAP